MTTRLGISIDGGGQLGRIPAQLLQDIEATLRQPLHSVTDMLSGTSSGGIIAILLAADTPAKQVTAFFTNEGPRIFKKQSWFNPLGIFKAQYSGAVIENILESILTTQTLKDVKTPVVVPAFDIRGHKPFFFKTTAAKWNPEYDYELWEVARATSAAQTYFPAFQLNRMTLIDGGNIANNPAACLYAEMKREWPLDRIRILSIGCGNKRSKSNKRAMGNAGYWGAIRNLITTFDVLFSGGPEVVDYELSILMGHDYMRLEPTLIEDVTLDGATPVYQARLASEGKHFSEKNLLKALKFIQGKPL